MTPEEKNKLKAALETYGKQIDLEIARNTGAEASGSEVYINDVSPISHTVGVTLKKENISDFTGYKITTIGKNLFNPVIDNSQYLVTTEVLENQQIKQTGKEAGKTHGYSQFKINLKAGTYTITGSATPNENNINQSITIWDAPNASNKRIYELRVSAAGGTNTGSFTITQPGDYWLGLYGGVPKDETVYFTIQIEKGTTATRYQPCKYAEYEAKADGTVAGVKSIPYEMVITAPTGCTAEIEYKKTITYSSENIVSCPISYEGSLLSAIMKQAEIELTGVGGQEFAEGIKGEEIYITLTVTGEQTAQKEYGTFIVKDAEYKDETQSVILTSYDKMLRAMKPYSAVVEFPVEEEPEEGTEAATIAETSEPVTLGSYLQAICDYLGIVLATPTFTNSDVIIDEEKYNADYTFRDVLAEIAQAAAGTIAIKNDQLYVLYPTASGVTIEPSNLKSIEIGKLYGPVNSVVLARTPQEDNIYRKDETAQTICEIKIENNQLMDSHRDDFIDGIYEALNNLTYYPHDIESFGIGILDICDLFTIETLDGKTYTALHISGEVEITQGLVERTKGDAPKATETDYKAASTTDRLLNKTILIVDKQEQLIQALVSRTTTVEDELTGQKKEIENWTEQQITPEGLEILVNEKLKGIDSITTATGYTLGKDGLNIHKTGEEMENLLDHTGMYVNRVDGDGDLEENILTANNEGVNAVNLTARKYLTIGNNSRFEDYGTGRTACFYIGG